MSAIIIFDIMFNFLCMLVSNFVIYCLKKHQQSMLMVNKNVIIYLNFSLAVCINIVVNSSVCLNCVLKFIEILIQAIIHIISLVCYVSPIPTLIAYMIYSISLISVFLMYWLIIYFRILVVFYVKILNPKIIIFIH